MARDDHLPDEEPTAEEAAEAGAAVVDPDRLLRLRTVFALATLLTGLLFVLFASTVIALSLSGRLSPIFSLGASLLSIGVLALLVRAPLRALAAVRPASDEIRSAAGFVSLATGILLLGACAVFLVFTFSVVLIAGGSAILFVVPLGGLTYLSYGFIREATSDFFKKTSPRRETLLFLTSLGHFLFLFFVFIVVAAASRAAPFTLVSPADGATICAGTPIDIEVTDPNVANLTWDTGAGPQPLAAPYNISTSGWPLGPLNVTINASDAGGSLHSSRFSFVLGAARPPCA